MNHAHLKRKGRCIFSIRIFSAFWLILFETIVVFVCYYPNTAIRTPINFRLTELFFSLGSPSFGGVIFQMHLLLFQGPLRFTLCFPFLVFDWESKAFNVFWDRLKRPIFSLWLLVFKVWIITTIFCSFIRISILLWALIVCA